MRDVLGIKALTRRLEMLEGSIQSIAQSPQAPAGGLDIPKLLQDPMVKSIVDTLTTLAKQVVMGPQEDAATVRRRTLFDKVQEKYENKLLNEMDMLADRIASGQGLIIETEPPKTDIGKPDGKGLQK